MKKRKIALIAASWDGETLAATINGIKERLDGIGMDLYVFLCFPAFGLDSPDNISQFNIFSLPHYEDYDGYIFSINVVQGYDMLKKYHQHNSQPLFCQHNSPRLTALRDCSAEQRRYPLNRHQ